MADKYDKYSRDDLIRLLRERDRKPKFGLVWERDEIDHDNSVNNDFIALDYDPELSHGEEPHENLLIEGDNFDALRYLRMTHAGKVKCIYIDPPYNTGNKDFIYNDHFLDPDDVYKHSKWLEFMYRRLILARDLLREDGVMFVSIGEEEVSHLSLLMDQVFPGMKVATFVWRRRSGANDAKGAFVSPDHEYVLCYGGPEFSFSGEEKDLSRYTNPDKDPRGPWVRSDLTCNKTHLERPTLYYPITDPNTGIEYQCSKNRVWAHEKNRMKSLIAEGKVLFPESEDGTPTYKRHVSELKKTEKPLSTWIVPFSENTPDEDDIEIMQSGMTQEGTKLIQQMLGSKAFSYPKPLSLLVNLIKQSTSKNDLILDFFAGSATTAHAVMQVNAEDEGSRKFIMVSSTEANDSEPDKNVCRDVAQKRLIAAIEGYSYKSGKNNKDVEGLGGEFAYLRTKHIPVETVFNEIQHEQIWTALQLIHENGFGHYKDKAVIQVRESQNSFIAYIPKLTDEALEKVQNAVKDKTSVTLYSWQPALLKQRINNSSFAFEPIPQFLTDRFGVGG